MWEVGQDGDEYGGYDGGYLSNDHWTNDSLVIQEILSQ